MIETKSIAIDGIDFKVSQFTATEAYRLKRRLAKIALPLVSGVLGGTELSKDTNLMDSKIDMKAVGSALGGLLDDLSENEFIDLLHRMLSATGCMYRDKPGAEPRWINFADNMETNIDLVFTGKTLTIYPLLLFILQVNYPDFFAKVGSIGNLAKTFMSKQGN